MDYDCHYGAACDPVARDWRARLAHRTERDDDGEVRTPRDVVAVLGFDPRYDATYLAALEAAEDAR